MTPAVNQRQHLLQEQNTFMVTSRKLSNMEVTFMPGAWKKGPPVCFFRWSDIEGKATSTRAISMPNWVDSPRLGF